MRSFGKFFGLPGLRLGALIAPQDTLETVRRCLGIWSVSGPALAAGAQAYRDSGWQQETRHRLATARTRLDAVLDAAGLRVAGGVDLFRFVGVDDANSVWHRLAGCGISVRRFDWGRNRLLRIGLPPDADAEARLAQGATRSLTFREYLRVGHDVLQSEFRPARDSELRPEAGHKSRFRGREVQDLLIVGVKQVHHLPLQSQSSDTPAILE